MAGSGASDVSREGFQVAYHGDRRDDHSIDVEALAPALLGFGQLIRESNAVLNGNRARVKILVTSDFEHKCFQINFEVLQTAIQKLKSFLEDDRVKTAKELLQTIGVIRSSGAGSLLDYLKWKRNKSGEKIEVLPTPASTAPSLITIQITGDNNTITITPEVLKLAENPRVLEAIKETLTPVETNGSARVEFRDHDQPVASISGDEAREIMREIDKAPEALPIADNPTPDTVVATLYVYSPVFDEKAKRWRFVYKRNRHIYADISETSIAADALKRGGSFVNDRYRVRMEIMPPDTEDGEPHYKIVAVLEFTPAPQQGSLHLTKSRRSKNVAKKRKRV